MTDQTDTTTEVVNQPTDPRDIAAEIMLDAARTAEHPDITPDIAELIAVADIDISWPDQTDAAHRAWPVGSPQWAVIRAAIAWRRQFGPDSGVGGVPPATPAGRALVDAVDALPDAHDQGAAGAMLATDLLDRIQAAEDERDRYRVAVNAANAEQRKLTNDLDQARWSRDHAWRAWRTVLDDLEQARHSIAVQAEQLRRNGTLIVRLRDLSEEADRAWANHDTVTAERDGAPVGHMELTRIERLDDPPADRDDRLAAIVADVLSLHVLPEGALDLNPTAAGRIAVQALADVWAFGVGSRCEMCGAELPRAVGELARCVTCSAEDPAGLDLSDVLRQRIAQAAEPDGLVAQMSRQIGQLTSRALDAERDRDHALARLDRWRPEIRDLGNADLALRGALWPADGSHHLTIPSCEPVDAVRWLIREVTQTRRAREDLRETAAEARLDLADARDELERLRSQPSQGQDIPGEQPYGGRS